MNSSRTIALAAIILMLGTHVLADEPSAVDVLQKVAAKYQSMETYKAEGTITTEVDTGARTVNQETSFSILLKKPNLYLISWQQTGGPMVQSGTVWSDGTQPFLHMGVINSYSKMKNDEMALSAATGISGGAAFTIPSLFMSLFHQQGPPLSKLKNPKIERSDTIGEDDCYVIVGPSATSKKETLWISKQSHLIRQYERSMEPPEGRTLIPEMTDEQLAEALEGVGQEVTEENKKLMKETMERTRKMIKTMKMKGFSRELHKTVSTPELTGADFQFSPKGAVLKESLFGTGN